MIKADPNIKQEIYYNTPKRYIHIFGQEKLADNLNTVLTKHFKKYHLNFKLKQSEDLSLPKVSNKPSFIDRAYNTDKSLTNNMRFGILHIRWLHKYLEEKPTVIIFVFDIEGKEFNEYISDFISIYKQNELSIRKNKIKCLYILFNSKQKVEEEKNAMKNIFDISNKNIIQTRSEFFEDCFKDIESFIKNNSTSFYQSKIVKYKDNLLLGNPENLRFKEYYIRNLIKIAYFNLFLNENRKSLKYFDKSLKMCYELLKFYHKYCKENILSEEKETLLKYFYYVQKCEEIKRIANLLKNWIIFIKYKEKDLNHSEIFREYYLHIKELKGSDTWSLTPFKHFKSLFHINFIYVFLYFIKKSVKVQEIYFKMNILVVIKNLIEVCLTFFSVFDFKDGYKHKYIPFSIGLLLRSETHNLEKVELDNINETLLIDCPAYEQRKSYFVEIEQLIGELMESNYHTHILRLFNIVMIMRYDYVMHLNKGKVESAGAIMLDKSFKSYPNVYRKILKAIQSNQKNMNFVLKELIEFNEQDLSLIDMYIKAEDSEKIHIEVNNLNFNLDRVFSKSCIDKYDRINIDFILKSKNKSILNYVNKIQLKFNHNYYDEEINQITQTDDSITFKQRIKNHNPNIGQSLITLEKVMLVIQDLIYIEIKDVVEKSKGISKIKIVEKDFLTFDTDVSYENHLNNEYFPVKLTFKQNLNNWKDYVILGMRLNITPNDPKNLLKSVKLYEKKKEKKGSSLRTINTQTVNTTPGIITFDPTDSNNQRLFNTESVKETLNPDLEVLNSGNNISRDKFSLTESFSELTLEKEYFMKIKLTMDFNLELEWEVTMDIANENGEIIRSEIVGLKKKLKIKCGFFISKNQQLLNDNYILETAKSQKISDRLVQTNARYYLNFYLKSNHKSIEVLEFNFHPEESTKLLQSINQFEQLTIDFNEGTNIGIIFMIEEVVKEYNIGNLFIKWRRQGTPYITKTQFKNLLIVTSYKVPFQFSISCPIKAVYCQRFNLQYTVKNITDQALKLKVKFREKSNLMIAGMKSMHLDLQPQESKKVIVFIVATKVGICHLPDYTVKIYDTKQKYGIHNLKKIEVVYDALEE